MATTITANGINFPDGSAGSPSIGGSDTNTGLFTGSDIVGFATGGSERLKIDASGNVNIANDSGKLQLGASNDLQIYHNGSHSYIHDAGTGNLKIKSTRVDILNSAGDEDMIVAVENGQVELHYDNSKKFETTSAGTKHGDAVKGAYGNDQDLLLYHESGVNYIQTVNSTNLEFYAGSDKAIRYVANGTVELYHNGSKKFETTSSGVDITGNCTITGNFRGNDNVKLNLGNGDDLQIYHDGSDSFIKDAGTGGIRVDTNQFVVRSADGNTNHMIISDTGAMNVQGVYSQTTSSGANVNVASDGHIRRSTSSRRYKNTITDATHGLTELLKLKSVTFKGNEDGDTVFGGLIAEDVHNAGLIEFVHYDKDNEPDALAYGNMVALCVKAIQDLNAKVEALEAA